jgi:excisionase family DNA binding protein
MSVDEAASFLGVSHRRVTQLLAERKLRGKKTAGVWAIDASDVIIRMPDESEPIGTPSEAA